ncbi:aminoglycoside phosphotransferase [Streptomyces sp. Tu 6176]|uniref:phosphotransferase n=1 Tax=Streptomyces sp. Tu 6176 TaxID=1470557 RepID=UPI000445CB96|nr:phosphotransferase [Streptomyces sp. Tu 6176]EYT79046.1 aminoglycoside phosphotransferase [Streptomyces sp. Tu 6176]
MPLELASSARLHAVEASGDESRVEGPLRGYHHETYVFPLAGEAGALRPGRWKCREPRGDLLWFDRRCFASEEQLLSALRGRIGRIPELIEVGGTRLQRFIEGRTLGALCPSGNAVPGDLFRQTAALFGELIAVTPGMLAVERRCAAEDRPADGDTAAFLERLVLFAEERVYARNLAEFGGLFTDLRIDAEVFERLRKHLKGLRERPFCLLHADLHRENFIVDAERRLWTIDWELAMLGDPLYDLATHLYLMRYPRWQARRMTQAWCRTAEAVRPGSSRGWEHDLGLLVDFKRAQSVFTDVIRTALSLGSGAEPDRRGLAALGGRLHRILAAAALPLALESVPSPARVAAALARWHRTHGPHGPHAPHGARRGHRAP